MKRLRVRWKESSVEEMLDRFSTDVTPDKIFLPTNKPLPAGTPVEFEFLLVDRHPFLVGTATVVTAHEPGQSRRPGMVLRFDQLDELASGSFMAELRKWISPKTVEATVTWPPDDPDAHWPGDEVDDTHPDANPAGYRKNGR